jgi:hypothetical protein
MVFVADADLAEGQLLCEESTVKRGKSLKFLTGTSLKQGRTKFKTSININKKKRI